MCAEEFVIFEMQFERSGSLQIVADSSLERFLYLVMSVDLRAYDVVL